MVTSFFRWSLFQVLLLLIIYEALLILTSISMMLCTSRKGAALELQEIMSDSGWSFYCDTYQWLVDCLVLPSVSWNCWLGVRKSVWHVKLEWWAAGMFVWLVWGAADAVTIPIITCLGKIHYGVTFLVRAYPSCRGKLAVNLVLSDDVKSVHGLFTNTPVITICFSISLTWTKWKKEGQWSRVCECLCCIFVVVLDCSSCWMGWLLL